MPVYPLLKIRDHLFVDLGEGSPWLISTGTPISFGRGPLHFGGHAFDVPDNFAGFDPDLLQDAIRLDLEEGTCGGAIGTDALNRFDLVFDLPKGVLEVSEDPIDPFGEVIGIELVSVPHPTLPPGIGSPRFRVTIAGAACRAFLETASKLSYFTRIPQGAQPTGTDEDFFPLMVQGLAVGVWDTTVYELPVQLGNVSMRLRFGRQPEILEALLQQAGGDAILSSEILEGRRVGYFPRRQLLALG